MVYSSSFSSTARPSGPLPSVASNWRSLQRPLQHYSDCHWRPYCRKKLQAAIVYRRLQQTSCWRVLVKAVRASCYRGGSSGRPGTIADSPQGGRCWVRWWYSCFCCCQWRPWPMPWLFTCFIAFNYFHYNLWNWAAVEAQIEWDRGRCASTWLTNYRASSETASAAVCPWVHLWPGWRPHWSCL